jgi:hypothetical protein
MRNPDAVPPEVRAQLERLMDTPSLFLRDIDPVRGTAVLTPMSEDSYRASSFLDTRIRRGSDRELAIPLDTLLHLVSASGAPRPTLNYIFHVGHCGSSLLSRLLGELPDFLALREPPVLMGLARSHRRLDEPGFPIPPDAWERYLALGVAMLGRTWREGQRVLVKPTSHVANIIPQLMRHSGDERALLLFVDLETYLAAMLRPGVRQETRLYARDFRLRDFARVAPAAAATLGPASDIGDARLAAMNWLLQTGEFAVALGDPALQGRLLTVCFDSFLAAPRRGLTAICRFLGADQDPAAIATALAGPAATHHAKAPGNAYDAGRRTEELDAARAQCADEIRDGLAWARAVSGPDSPFAGLIERFSRPTGPPALP